MLSRVSRGQNRFLLVSFFQKLMHNIYRYTRLEANYLSVPLYAVATLSLVLFTYVSDRINRRGVMIIIPACFAALGYAIAVGQNNPRVGFMAMFFVAAGIYPMGVLHISSVLNPLLSIFRTACAPASIYIPTLPAQSSQRCHKDDALTFDNPAGSPTTWPRIASVLSPFPFSCPSWWCLASCPPKYILPKTRPITQWAMLFHFAETLPRVVGPFCSGLYGVGAMPTRASSRQRDRR